MIHSQFLVLCEVILSKNLLHSFVDVILCHFLWLSACLFHSPSRSLSLFLSLSLSLSLSLFSFFLSLSLSLPCHSFALHSLPILSRASTSSGLRCLNLSLARDIQCEIYCPPTWERRF